MFTSKLQLQYQRSATENTLMTYQLDCPELLKLTGLPGRLIVALFDHSSVVERMKSPAGQTYPGENKSRNKVLITQALTLKQSLDFECSVGILYKR